MPSYLSTTRFNDPQMISRFQQLIDYVFTRVDPAVILNLQIGNEIDGYDTSAEPATFWADYGTFLQEITTYMHTNYPNIPVGFTGTLYGLNAEPQRFNDLLGNVDVLGVTYYPLEPNFEVKDPSVVDAELNELTESYPTATIYMQEVGYPSGGPNNSSEDKQAEFFLSLLLGLG